MNSNASQFTKPHAAIVTALDLEFEAVEQHLKGVNEQQHPAGTIYRVGDFDGRLKWRVAVVRAGMHNVPAALETERLINYFQPLVVLLVGVAGGLKDVRLGDVVAATKIYAYEAGKDETEFKPRPEIGESSYGLVQRASAVKREGAWVSRIIGGSPEPKPDAFVGPLAAGEKVVGDITSATFKLLRSQFGDALATEMEGYGFLRANYMNEGVQALAVRGISDMVLDKEEADRSGSQPRAAANAAAFAFEVLAQTDFGRQSHSVPEDDWFRALETIAAQLYPSGPNDRQIWSRSGGDTAQLEIERTAVAAWHSALRTLRLGGGGAEISPSSLVMGMLSDYPKNAALFELLRKG